MGSKSLAHLAQRQSIVNYLADQFLLLAWCSEIDAPLQDAAAMPVGGNLNRMLGSSIVDKLAVLWTQPLEAALDHMIAIQVSDECYNPWLQRLNDQLDLQEHKI